MLGAGFRRPHFLPIFPVHRSNQIDASSRRCEAGEILFRSGETGTAWRLTHGVIRLDQPEAGFAGLSIAGDILGCETMLFGQYSFSATALTSCLIVSWPGEKQADSASLLDSLAHAQRRAADLVALRGGQAVGRIMKLVRLLADREGRVILPTRNDIADITDLRFETVSRLIHSLVRDEVLSPIRIDGIHATRSFSLNVA